MPVTIVHPGNESVPKAAKPPARLKSWREKDRAARYQQTGRQLLPGPAGRDSADEIWRCRNFARQEADVFQERPTTDHRATAWHGRGVEGLAD